MDVNRDKWSGEGNFTEENINNLQLYPKFICNPVKDEGQITT